MDQTEKWTDTMQVCRNGHLINHSYINNSERNQDYCKKCGKETIIKCLNCDQEIPGKNSYSRRNPYISWSSPQLLPIL